MHLGYSPQTSSSTSTSPEKYATHRRPSGAGLSPLLNLPSPVPGPKETTMNGKSLGGAGNGLLPTWLRGAGGNVLTRGHRHSSITPRSLLLPLLLFLSFSLGVLLSPSRSSSPLSHLFSPSPPPFYVPPTNFLSPPPYPKSSLWPDLAQEGVQQSMKKGQLVPNVVHYVYGLKEPSDAGKKERGEGEVFPYYAYLGIRSAIKNIKPERIYFHYKYLPTGPWFDLLRPQLTLRELATVPDHVLGNKMSHFAHKSDILRLDALLNTGGIYLDIDMYILRSFDKLLYHPTTLGMESSPSSERDSMDPEGLCNGVIVAAPHSSFLERWKATYEDFKDGEWAQHSVVKPWELARRYPDEVQVLNNKAFFWPMWHGEEIQKVHQTTEYDFYGTGQYAYHSWESLAMRWLGELSPSSIKTVDSSFNKMVRPFVGEDDERVWKKWKGVV